MRTINKRKRGLRIVIGILLVCLVAAGCIAGRYVIRHREVRSQLAAIPDVVMGNGESGASGQELRLINASGKTLEDRIRTPEGYQRTEEDKGSLAEFLRHYKMKKDGSPVRLYNGKKKWNQKAHVAVFRLPIEKEDLQQCADSVMRVYGEYYYQKGAYDKIRYKMGGGFVASFDEWSRGRGIALDGDRLYWVDAAANDSSYASFQKFMRMVFAYSGTLNLEDDSRKIATSDIRVGDIFIKGGSPGHVVMVVDLCENAQGKKAFLLAQGYMPAQEFHVLKNPLYSEDPWYYVDEIHYPFETAEYTFEKKALRRPNLEE